MLFTLSRSRTEQGPYRMGPIGRGRGALAAWVTWEGSRGRFACRLPHFHLYNYRVLSGPGRTKMLSHPLCFHLEGGRTGVHKMLACKYATPIPFLKHIATSFRAQSVALRICRRCPRAGIEPTMCRTSAGYHVRNFNRSVWKRKRDRGCNR